jgi:hypothetical protein
MTTTVEMLAKAAEAEKLRVGRIIYRTLLLTCVTEKRQQRPDRMGAFASAGKNARRSVRFPVAICSPTARARHND